MNADTVQKLLTSGKNAFQIAEHLKNKGLTADESTAALEEAGISVHREDAGWGIVLHIGIKPSLGFGNTLDTLAGVTRELAWPN